MLSDRTMLVDLHLNGFAYAVQSQALKQLAYTPNPMVPRVAGLAYFGQLRT